VNEDELFGKLYIMNIINIILFGIIVALYEITKEIDFFILAGTFSFIVIGTIVLSCILMISYHK